MSIDDTTLAAIRVLWEDYPKLSASYIGARFGISKNAVISHAHRRGWKLRGVPMPKSPSADGATQFPPSGRCVYPIGHPRQPGFAFCGNASASPGVPYCHEHMALCYRPIETETAVANTAAEAAE